MANFCSNCGSSVNEGMTFCPNCGSALHKSATADAAYDTAQTQNKGTDASAFAAGAAGALGTLVAVSLIGGVTRQMYYYGGRYYLDPFCRRPFANPHLILSRRLWGPPRPFAPRPPMGPMGRPPMGRPPMGGGLFGGPRGGGPRGGGPRGRR